MSAPRLPAALLDDGWREVDHESKDELSTPVFSVRSHNRIYEHAASADGHRGLVAVELGTGLRSAFTTGLEFDPPLSRFGVSPGASSVFRIARERARREFPRSVSEDGLLDVTHTDSRWVERTDGTRARAFRYDARVPLHTAVALSGDSREASHRRGTGRRGRDLTIRAVLWGAIWPTAGAYDMAGGIYPVETLSEAVDRAFPGREPDPEVVVDVDPEAHRKVVGRILQAAGG